jgi:putative acetyltransferase
MIKPLENEKIKDVMDIWLKTNIAAHSFIPEKYWLENYHIAKRIFIFFLCIDFISRTKLFYIRSI